MKKNIPVKELMKLLNRENIQTWFDLGLFIDRVRENREVPFTRFHGTYDGYRKYLSEASMAFITFHYSVDGVTVEVEKYAKIYRMNYPQLKVHYIAGKFFPESKELIDPSAICYEIPEADGFGKWKLYHDFFFEKLERGSKKYNELILAFWKEVKGLVKELGAYVEKNDISLLYLINVCANPGNVSLSLAIVLLSEYLGIPVINNNHDFYWEGGNRKIDIEQKGLAPGPRDFFFTNAHVGEFFSIIEMLFPWESRGWINVNINKEQSRHLVEKNGHNPANVMEIGTAVDLNEYTNISKRKQINAFYQFEKILSRYREALISYSVNDVLHSQLVNPDNPKPILIGLRKSKPIQHFLNENIIFLQPTRIISRKRIETGFHLVEKLFAYKAFNDKLRETKHLKLTILVTGPIATGHFDYFEVLVEHFGELLNSLDEELSSKVYLAFLFSELDKESFKKHFPDPVGIPDLYNIASLVLLPSKTEGRGLPIIEATACGTPIFVRRYSPETVYSEVIGEKLPEEDRLKVIEFDGKKIKYSHVQKIFERVFFPHKFMDEVEHNLHVVQKRFSLEALNQNIKEICSRLYLQLQSPEYSIKQVKETLDIYKKQNQVENADLDVILHARKRQYLPGYGKLAFMIYLKSLIDPSYFRMEEQEVRGMAFAFAREMVEKDPEHGLIPEEKIAAFYNAVDHLFLYHEGEVNIRHDHSMSYRHRNRQYYPYQDYTAQEITGIINLLYHSIIQSYVSNKVNESSHFFTDWNLALSQLISCTCLEIDNRDMLIEKLQQNIPIGIFYGLYVKYELEFFALQSVRSRLKLPIHEELTEEILQKQASRIRPVYVFAHEKPLRGWASSGDLLEYIGRKDNSELHLLYKYNILRLVVSEQLCVGVHFRQMGKEALKALREIHDEKGVLIFHRRSAAVMSDIVDIDRFHLGKVYQEVTANMMGVPVGCGYIQFVPAGVRTILSYPAPVQTAKDFNEALKSPLFKELTEKYGRQCIWDFLRKDAEEGDSPILEVLEKLKGPEQKETRVEYKYVSDLYRDGMPWNGVFAKTRKLPDGKKWQFVAVSGGGQTSRVTQFAVDFEKHAGKKVEIAWNGGYILNPELVGKLGLPESYIGSPLGLIISGGKILSVPLFNKAALLVTKDGKADIRRINLGGGFDLRIKGKTIEFRPSSYNCEKDHPPVCYYDLLYPHDEIEGNGRVLVQLAGNRVKRIYPSKTGEMVKIIPVGVTLSFDTKAFSSGLFAVDMEVDFFIKELVGVEHAVEAGPMLVDEGKFVLDMEQEGWKHPNSIRTQAARLDYTDMRGPKIAAGIDSPGNLCVLAVNGRIRESVGATHGDMADILMKFGIKKAMGFDPGGSSTLVVNGKTLNISPYNRDYEMNIYALSPEPRAVSNAILGYVE